MPVMKPAPPQMGQDALLARLGECAALQALHMWRRRDTLIWAQPGLRWTASPS